MMEGLFLEEAEIELSEAVAYYENICQGLGLDFSNEVKTLIIRIIEIPFLWVLRDDGTRRVSTKKFPYQIIYCVINDVIWIIAVAHHKRFPEYWKERLSFNPMH